MNLKTNKNNPKNIQKLKNEIKIFSQRTKTAIVISPTMESGKCCLLFDLHQEFMC